MTQSSERLVAVIGAGPAGIYAAGELAKKGHHAVLLNRDFKAGGLVEYGVYPTKHKFKNGIRRQFVKILDNPLVSYRGLVNVGSQQPAVSLDELVAVGFDAIVLAVGAQGTKKLGLDGEDAQGVFHAKDLVYHYNLLPPFAEQTYEMGDKVVIIGVGNVMIDVVHWLYQFKQTKDIIAVARSVPRVRKYTPKEVKEVAPALDPEAMRAEVERVRDDLLKGGEDPDADIAALLKFAPAPEDRSESSWRCRWLRQPKAIALDEEGRCKGLITEVLTCEPTPGDARPKSIKTGEEELIEADTVIFAIGDSVDPNMGLPIGWYGFKTLADIDSDLESAEYRVLKPDESGHYEPIFSVGWARKASTGLVGVARKDAVKGVGHVVSFLEDRPASSATAAERLAKLDALLGERGMKTVDWAANKRLIEAEHARGKEAPLEGKFSSNDAMWSAVRGS